MGICVLWCVFPQRQEYTSSNHIQQPSLLVLFHHCSSPVEWTQLPSSFLQRFKYSTHYVRLRKNEGGRETWGRSWGNTEYFKTVLMLHLLWEGTKNDGKCTISSTLFSLLQIRNSAHLLLECNVQMRFIFFLLATGCSLEALTVKCVVIHIFIFSLFNL